MRTGKASEDLYRGVVEYMLAKQMAIKRQQLYALWLTEEQWAQELLKWASSTAAMSNTIFTVYEMIQGDERLLFHGMDPDLFLSLLEGMERKGLVQLLRTTADDINTIGVKFIKI
jgi:hypothetical protein